MPDKVTISIEDGKYFIKEIFTGKKIGAFYGWKTLSAVLRYLQKNEYPIDPDLQNKIIADQKTKKDEYNKIYYKKNQKKLTAKARKKYQKKPKIKPTAQEIAEKKAVQKAAQKEYQIKYLAENKEKRNAYRRERYQRLKEKINKYNAAWQKAKRHAAKAGNQIQIESTKEKCPNRYALMSPNEREEYKRKARERYHLKKQK
jgi:hypothetical protein